jgi:hypothetical protein
MAWDETQITSSTPVVDLSPKENQDDSKFMPSVCIGLPYREKFSFQFFKGLYTVKLPPMYDMAVDGGSRPLDLSRNVIVSMALKGRFEYLYFLDSDCVIHDDLTINKLMKKQEKIVAALYTSRSVPGLVVGTTKDEKPLMVDDPRVKAGEMIEMESVGMGSTLIHNSVFLEIGKTRRWRCLTNHSKEGFDNGVFSVNFDEAVKNEFTCPFCKNLLIATFFHYTHGKFDGDEGDEDGFPIGVVSEDYFFCKLAQRAGFTVKLASDISVWHETSDWLSTKDGLVTLQKHGGQL